MWILDVADWKSREIFQQMFLNTVWMVCLPESSATGWCQLPPVRSIQTLGSRADPLLHPPWWKLPVVVLPRQLPEVSTFVFRIILPVCFTHYTGSQLSTKARLVLTCGLYLFFQPGGHSRLRKAQHRLPWGELTGPLRLDPGTQTDHGQGCRVGSSQQPAPTGRPQCQPQPLPGNIHLWSCHKGTP